MSKSALKQKKFYYVLQNYLSEIRKTNRRLTVFNIKWGSYVEPNSLLRRMARKLNDPLNIENEESLKKKISKES